MNPRAHAIRIGLQRGWTEFKLSLRAPEDMTFYVVWGLGILIYLFVNRDNAVEGTGLSTAVVALPGVLAAMVVFGAVVGPAFTLVLEREDGTLLRAKSAPFGLDAYVAGQVLFQFLGVLPMLILLLVPPAFFLEGLAPQGAVGWVVAVVLVVLGTLAMLPLGFIVGSLARKAVHVSTGAMMPIMGLAAISGILSPITVLWGWLQVVAQVFPMYWLGHALRWVFLPEEAAALELGGRWNLLGALAVIALWGAVGLALTPRILGRMAQRESGSAVEARKVERLQRLA
jgi:ABC-2 type transport system permease protein